MYMILSIIVFIISFIGSLFFKLKYKPKSLRRFEIKKRRPLCWNKGNRSGLWRETGK